jgi:DNA-binding transcriptional LysR family regulator
VKSLEQKLGVQLFDRHSRHVELTPPGRRLLYGARKILHDFDRTVSAVVRDRKGNGHLTVGYSPYVDLRFMTELEEMALGESLTANISFETSSSEEMVLNVERRVWECGIVILPVDAPHLEIIPLFRLPLAAAMQKTHRLAKRRALRIEDLVNESLILGGKRRDLQFRGWLLSRLSDAGITPRIAAETSSPHDAQYLVTRGVGMALANSGAFRTSPEGVVVRLFPSELVQTQTAILVRKGSHSSGMAVFLNRVLQMAKARGRSRLPMRPAA